MESFLHCAALAALLAISTTTTLAQPTFCDYEWATLISGYVAIGGHPSVATSWDSDGDGTLPEELIVGGNISILRDRTPVARFDGSQWRPMVAGLDPESTIQSLAVWNGVPVAATTSYVEEVQRNKVMLWTSSEWRGIGEFDFPVISTIQSGNDLYACGFFGSVDGTPAYGIARYDGASWSALASTAFVAIDAAIFQGDLVVVGWSGQTGSTVRRWSGFHWVDLAPVGFTGFVAYGTVHQDLLVVSGAIESANGIPVRRIAAFDGNRWFALGEPDEPNSPYDLSEIDVLTGRLFSRTNGTVQEWDGTSWIAPPEFDQVSNVQRMSEWRDQIVIDASFAGPGITTDRGLAAWDGAAWIPATVGDPKTIYFAEALGEDLVVGGLFDRLDGFAVRNLAAWDGAQWREVGGAPDGAVRDGFVHHGELFVFGDFTHIGDAAVNRAARWDGAEWRQFVDRDQLVVDVDAIFRPFGNAIQRWSGTEWVFDRTRESSCGLYSSIFRNDTYAISWQSNGGPSSTWTLKRERGGECAGVASGYSDRYNFSSGLTLLGVVGEKLVGNYHTSRSSGGFTSSSAWAWDGERTLSTFGGGSSGGPAILENPDTSILAINWLGGNLVVGGNFRSFGGSSAEYIAQWHGSHWAALGEGVNARVARVRQWRDQLVVVGEFSTAGGLLAPGIALWRCPPSCSCDGDGDGIADEMDACPGYNDTTDSDGNGVPDCLEPPPDDSGNDNSGAGNSNSDNSNSPDDPSGTNQNDNSPAGGGSENSNVNGDVLPGGSNENTNVNDDASRDVPEMLPLEACGACGSSAPVGLIAGLVGSLAFRRRLF